MSNRNFDASIATKRFRDKTVSQNIYSNFKNGLQIVSNPQISNANQSIISQYIEGSQTVYETSEQGFTTIDLGGIANLIANPPPPIPPALQLTFNNLGGGSFTNTTFVRSGASSQVLIQTPSYSTLNNTLVLNFTIAPYLDPSAVQFSIWDASGYFTSLYLNNNNYSTYPNGTTIAQPGTSSFTIVADGTFVNFYINNSLFNQKTYSSIDSRFTSSRPIFFYIYTDFPTTNTITITNFTAYLTYR